MNDSKSVLDKVASHIKALPKSGIRDFFELVNAMDDVISLGIGEPDFVTPWHILEAAIFSLEKGHTTYTSNLGLLSLRQEICKRIAGNYNVSYDAKDECIVTVGVSEALDLVLRAILNPGEEVIYHEPCFVSYASGIAMAHGVPVPILTEEKNKFTLDPEDLEAAITDKTKAVLLSFPCNPTGANLTLVQKKRIAEIAVKHDLIVITDEIYADLTYGEETAMIASLPGMQGRTVYLNGFSKSYAMTGFRIGYACGPAPLVDAMMKIHQYSMMCAAITGQEAAVEALRNGDRQMLEMKEEYRQRRNLLVKRFNAMGLSCLEPEGAFYVYPNISSTGLSSEEFAKQLLMTQSVAVVPGTAFTSRKGEDFIRCSYATSMKEICVALDRIELFLENLESGA